MKKELSELVEKALSKAPYDGMSEFQMKYFLIFKEVTAWGRYRQCCLEIKSRVDSLKSLELKLKLEEAKLNTLINTQPLNDVEKAEIELLEYEVSKLIAQRSDLEREVEFLATIGHELLLSLPPNQSWEESQPEYWSSNLLKEALQCVSCGVLPKDLMNAIQCLPKEWQSKVFFEIDTVNKKLLGKHTIKKQGEKNDQENKS